MDIDDEDVILKNSPLDQYLEQFDETYVKCPRNSELVIPKSVKRKHGMIKCFGFNELIFKSQIISCLKYIQEKGVMEDVDSDILNYLMILMDTNSVINTSQREAILGFFIFISILIGIFCKNIYTGLILFIISILLWLIVKFSIGLMYSYIFKMVINKYLKISAESRSLVLMLQEVLSINRGYNKIVSFSDKCENLKLSTSINEGPILAFSNRLFFLLSSYHYQNENNLKNLFKKYIKPYEFTLELSWLTDIDADICFNDERLNLEKPLFQLKTIHNICHEQTLSLIKLSVLLLINCDNYIGNISVLYKLLKMLFRDNLFLLNLQKTRLLLSIKNDNLMKKPEKEDKSQIQSLVQSYRLHIFELYSFVELFEQTNQSNMAELILKCKRHLDGLNTILLDINSLSCKDSDRSFENVDNSLTKSIDSVDDDKLSENIKELEDYEVVDEVLEAIIGSEKNEVNREQSIEMHVDTFDEKYKKNAGCLMKELQSVIDVKAAEWKEREIVAKKRRAAEGKFVLNDERATDELPNKNIQPDPPINSKIDTLDQITEYGDQENETNSLYQKTANENRDRFLLATNAFGGLSFQEMILKQRNLIQDSDEISENVFEGDT